MSAQAATSVINAREEVSVYWRPGCSSCLKVKEFVEETGIAFESVDVSASQEAMDEVIASGLRSIPAVRRGDRFIYAQSLDEVAKLLGVSRNHKRLPNNLLFQRWEPILLKARDIIAKFSDAELNGRVIPVRERTVKQLAVHIFQITVAFRKQMDEGVTDIRPICAYVDPAIVTKGDLLSYIDDRLALLRQWIASGRPEAIPDNIETFYGEQASSQVVERAVWHCAQHARQFDILAAGRLGCELEIPSELYAGLPLPRRLWA